MHDEIFLNLIVRYLCNRKLAIARTVVKPSSNVRAVKEKNPSLLSPIFAASPDSFETPCRSAARFGLIFAPRFSSSARGQRRWRAADVSVGTRNLRREFSKSLQAQRALFNYSRAKARLTLDIVSGGRPNDREREKDGVIIRHGIKRRREGEREIFRDPRIPPLSISMREFRRLVCWSPSPGSACENCGYYGNGAAVTAGKSRPVIKLCAQAFANLRKASAVIMRGRKFGISPFYIRAGASTNLWDACGERWERSR